MNHVTCPRTSATKQLLTRRGGGGGGVGPSARADPSPSGRRRTDPHAPLGPLFTTCTVLRCTVYTDHGPFRMDRYSHPTTTFALSKLIHLLFYFYQVSYYL